MLLLFFIDINLIKSNEKERHIENIYLKYQKQQQEQQQHQQKLLE
jgi:hypothetical protein